MHRDEVARAEQRLRIENLADRAMSEFGLETEALIADYGPDQLVPPSLRAPGDDVDPNAPEPAAYPYVRAEQERRLKTAEKAMALLGKVNPLALEEFAALEERHRFLTEQLDDLKRSRKDLLDLINDVDARVEEVFTAAYADVAVQFEQVFSRLFPGGAGRLVLTDPENMLTTGIEVEARPPGKKIKRLSLLSGGERSLTAVAFLVSLFQARPSPFYVLDEVEAALDDVNLGSAARRPRGAAREQPAHRDHAPEAHDGDRRRAVRREHARRRRDPRDQPAAAGAPGGVTRTRCARNRRSDGRFRAHHRAGRP